MPGQLDELKRRAGRVVAEIHGVATVTRAGLIGPERPDRLLAMGRALRVLGPIGGAATVAAIRHGDRTGIVDERGSLTFNDLDRRSTALADAWLARGIGTGDGVGILCRNHRGFLDATFACGKIGARALYLNTDFAGPQLREVAEREDVQALVHDEEFTEVVGEAAIPKGRFLAWTDQPAGDPTLDDLIEEGDPDTELRPDRPGTVVLLTSGTTGTPKGATRDQGRSMSGPGAILSKIPYRSGEVTFIAPPMFHAWGFANAVLAVGLGSTVVTRRKFSVEATLDALDEHRVTTLVVVPVLLSRLVAGLAKEADEAGGRHARDLSALRIVSVSGAQLEASLATRAMDLLGDCVYNFYGSTEVAWVTIATPEDMRAAPGTAGRPPFGTKLKLLDDHGREVPAGETGRIFVANGNAFGGYTGGGSKEVIDGLMSIGDIGHLDADGRLFVDGRDDDMIVSGGENLFPREIEELLGAHDDINEAAAIGVDDEEYGQRLRAFVALREGAEMSEDDVKGHVRSNLARYKVPRDVVFLDALPRNPAGKVLKRELREWDG